MFGAGDGDVTCIACGAEIPRDEAREYDKYGDRWTRDGKTFEYLCKPCFRALTKHSRDGLEDALGDVAGRGLDQAAFVSAFLEATRETAERE